MSSGRLGNVKSQIKHRALKSHEARVMRKVMGFGVWACLAGRQQPAANCHSFYLYLFLVCLSVRKRGEVKVFVYLTFLILDLEGSTKLQQCRTGGWVGTALDTPNLNPPGSPSDINHEPTVHPAYASHVFPGPVPLKITL